MAVDISPVIDGLIKILTVDEIDEWMDKENPYLDNKTPQQISATGDVTTVTNAVVKEFFEQNS